MHLLDGSQLQEYGLESFLQVSITTVVLAVIVMVLGFPLAQVAETFEYDVLRGLNNPATLNKAQKHFGQQLLPHLTTLEWGFRIGGVVIKMKLLMGVCSAIGITVITTVSRAVMDQMAY